MENTFINYMDGSAIAFKTMDLQSHSESVIAFRNYHGSIISFKNTMDGSVITFKTMDL